ncbi:MAG: PD-(D/E)XK nuclease family protein [Deltaproteobacteria bacterium]|jgi:hypothetical protein|nr:PD-(D/E)XK nuclease family protein [Deltaproteobacteria bacterium]
MSAFGFSAAATAGRPRPFSLIPWQRNFLSSLLDLALADSAGLGLPLGEALFIFPHARPARYLERLINLDSRLAKPCLLPEMLPVRQLFEKLRGEFLPPAVNIGRLDQIGLLLECVRAEQRENSGDFSALPTADVKLFFPWGARLANLFEDCFTHGVQPLNFLHLDEELSAYAALLLSRLGNLHRRYLEALADRNWTTSGLTAFHVADKIRQLPPGGDIGALFSPGRPVYLAGFYSLNGSEDILFRHLWEERQARVVVHADAALLEGGAHWSCAALEKWRGSWSARWDCAPAAEPPAGRPAIKYYSGYDLHSQLKAMQTAQALQAGEGSEEASSAVILPDTELLLPVLHHVQNKDLNISMGYPLDKSALNQLLDNILKLQENRRPGGYYWKDCVRLIRHPYIKMLAPEAAATVRPAGAVDMAWRAFLHSLEKTLRDANRRYLDFPALMRQAFLSREADAADAANLEKLLAEFSAVCIAAWQGLSSIGELAAALERLCSFLAAYGEALWPRFPIDAECLYRFRQCLGPELRFSALRGEKLPPETLFAILRGLVREERVPFEAYPLTAAQIMGLLESRLLSFDRVFILGASDDALPGGAQHDPLLPDGLRREIGLPDIFRKQRMTAYYFFRLLAGAGEVHIFWEKGAEGGLFDSKKQRSRFVEELLWQEEQRRGRLLEFGNNDGSSPLRQLGSELNTPVLAFRTPSPSIAGLNRQALHHKFSMTGPAGKSISAGKMNAFLTCPLAFYYRELAALQPVRDIVDGEDPAETGEFLHEVFYGHYSPKLGAALRKNEQSRTELINGFRRQLAESRIGESFPQDALAGLRALAQLRLGRYLNEQPELTRVVALETSARAELDLPDGQPDGRAGGRRFALVGRLDRIDERLFPGSETVLVEHGKLAGEFVPEASADKTGLVILDYKSGRISPPPPGFWSSSARWQAIFQALAEPEREHGELLAALSEDLNGNVQLPFYLHLLRHGRLDPETGEIAPELASTRAVRNAAWVDLGGDGKERMLLPDDLTEAALEEVLDRKIPALLALLLNEMSTASFTARPGKHCAYCAYAGLCRVAG